MSGVSGDDETNRPFSSPRRTYRSLIESAPDAILFADADTGELVEANEAAERLLGRPRHEIVGLHQTDLHPPEDAEAYREQFERHVDRGGTIRRLPDGRQMYVVDAEGDRVPVEISAKSIEVDGDHLIHGIFRDLTRRQRYEIALTTLQETSRELLSAQAPEAVYRTAVSAATDPLALERAAVFELDLEGGFLRLAMATEEADDVFDETTRIEPGESVAWRAFSEGEQRILDATGDVVDAVTDVGSVMIVPLGDHGLLVAADSEPDGFDATQVELASILGATATAALDRVERDQRLRERDRTLADRNERLERLEDLNRVLREVDRTLVRADTRDSVERTVCERLIDTSHIAFTWISSTNPVDGQLDVRAGVGRGLGYLGSIDREVSSGSEPAVRTARTIEPTYVANVAEDVRGEAWRSSALAADFRSVLAVPLVYRDVLYGVLTVYSDRPSAFDGRFGTILEEFGATVAHAINAIERRDALIAQARRTLEVVIHDPRCFLLRFANETDGSLTFEGISQSEDGVVSAIVTTDADLAAPLVSTALDDPSVAGARRVGDGNGETVVKLRLEGPFLGTMLAEHGLHLRSIEAGSDGLQVTITAPPSITPRRAMEIVRSRFPDAEFVATYDEEDQDAHRSIPESLDSLTDRQLEAAKLAYHAGYFDSTRKVSGDELASAMDISPSAFHRHLRAAERKLFESLFEGERTGEDGLWGRDIDDPE